MTLLEDGRCVWSLRVLLRLSLQSRFSVLYSTSGYLLPDASALAKLSSRLHIPPLAVSSDPASKTVDYTLPLVQNEIDSFLSHPSERSAIVLDKDAAVAKDRKRRAHDFRYRLSRDAKGAEKGRFDPSLVERARQIRPAFMQGDTKQYDIYGQTGYPANSILGVIVSGNAMNARRVCVTSAWGLGAIG